MKLGSEYDFTFVNAPHQSRPAPGINALFVSNNYTWWPTTTAPDIRAAHAWLDAYLAAHGPFDALMGFSQGCSLISSYLLYHARDAPLQPLPFKAAIFLCGGLPLAALEDLGLEVSERAWDINDRTAKSLAHKAGMLAEWAKNIDLVKPGVGLWDDTSDLLHDPSQRDNIDDADFFGLDYTSFPRDLRIDIPTVHVVGGKDPRWPSGMQLARFCEQVTTQAVFDHGGGHEIPRSSFVSLRIAQMVEGVVADLRRAR